MVPSSIGAVVPIPFPFTDLSNTKLRPAVVLADSGRGDFVICQITSKPYSDPRAVELTAHDFSRGTLRLTSYARPSKLFTANQSLISSEVGVLSLSAQARIIEAVIEFLRPSSPAAT